MENSTPFILLILFLFLIIFLLLDSHSISKKFKEECNTYWWVFREDISLCQYNGKFYDSRSDFKKQYYLNNPK